MVEILLNMFGLCLILWGFVKYFFVSPHQFISPDPHDGAGISGGPLRFGRPPAPGPRGRPSASRRCRWPNAVRAPLPRPRGRSQTHRPHIKNYCFRQPRIFVRSLTIFSIISVRNQVLGRYQVQGTKYKEQLYILTYVHTVGRDRTSCTYCTCRACCTCCSCCTYVMRMYIHTVNCEMFIDGKYV